MIQVETNADFVAHALARYCGAIAETLRSALQLWVLEAVEFVRARTPVRTGELARTVMGEATSGPDGPDAMIQAPKKYAPWVEGGTDPHRIEARKGWVRHALKFPSKDGGWMFCQAVNHPGTEPQPFFFDNISERIPELNGLAADAMGVLADRVGLGGE